MLAGSWVLAVDCRVAGRCPRAAYKHSKRPITVVQPGQNIVMLFGRWPVGHILKNFGNVRHALSHGVTVGSRIPTRRKVFELTFNVAQ